MREKQNPFQMKKTFMSALVLLGLAAAGATAGNISLTSTNLTNPFDVAYTDFTLGAGKGALASGSNAGGSYTFSTFDAVMSIGSGSAVGSFSLTITNNTGVTLTGINFAGTVYQTKKNSGGISETLTAAITGTNPGLTASSFNVVTPNTGTPSFAAPSTAALNVNVGSGLTLLDGQSFTITWTDSNDGGTDAVFGLGSVTVQAIAAVPEPYQYGLAMAGLLAVVVVRRRISSKKA